MGRLYVVGTPIGNLQDLSPRAQTVLSSVSVIACEDTRVTKKLLQHYKIPTATIAIHHHSSPTDLDHLLDRTAQGDVAVVTDAGMPGISDPGGKLVARAAERGIAMEVVPGPSALTAATALSGFPTDQFLFLGFLPHKKGRQTLFKRIAETEETVVLFESPHRILKTLESLAEVTPDRLLAVARELTKLHESVVRGTPAEALKHFTDHPDQARGEIVIVIGPSHPSGATRHLPSGRGGVE